MQPRPRRRHLLQRPLDVHDRAQHGGRDAAHDVRGHLRGFGVLASFQSEADLRGNQLDVEPRPLRARSSTHRSPPRITGVHQPATLLLSLTQLTICPRQRQIRRRSRKPSARRSSRWAGAAARGSRRRHLARTGLAPRRDQEEPGIGSGALAAKERVSPPAMTKHVDRLERDGLVARGRRGTTTGGAWARRLPRRVRRCSAASGRGARPGSQPASAGSTGGARGDRSRRGPLRKLLPEEERR